MGRDIVIGAVDGYEWPEVELWANSLKASGYAGRKALIAYDASDDFLAWARENDFEVVRAEKAPAQPVYWKRYFDVWKAAGKLELSDARYVIHTDVRDVVFQSDPSAWLDAAETCVFSTEAILHKDEWFNRECTKQAFGDEVYETIADQVVRCSGVIAGPWRELGPLFLNIYLLCRGSVIANCDQAAFNILIHGSDALSTPALAHGWAVNCAVAFDGELRPHLTEAPPQIEGGFVLTNSGKPFAVVHQYDRIPELRAAVARRHGTAARLR